MERRELFRQTNAFAMQYGAAFGLIWAIGFFCFINFFTQPLLMSIFVILFAATPIVGYLFTRQFRKQASDEGYLSFGRAYLFSTMIYFYATIILAAVCFIYFQYIDHGLFFETYIDYLNSPEMQAAMKTPEMQQELQALFPDGDITTGIRSVQSLSPIVMAANIVDVNVFLGLILSLPTALLCKKSNNIK